MWKQFFIFCTFLWAQSKKFHKLIWKTIVLQRQYKLAHVLFCRGRIVIYSLKLPGENTNVDKRPHHEPIRIDEIDLFCNGFSRPQKV